MDRSGHHPRVLLAVLGSVAVAALLAATTAACGGGGDRQETAAPDHVLAALSGAGVEGADRCDLGFNTAEFNDTTELVHHHDHAHAAGQADFTLDEWASIFVDEELGMTAQQALDDMAPDEIYVRHVLGGVLTHTLDPDPWMPMTDPAECEALAEQLRTVRDVANRHATVANAVADSYDRVDRYFAGLGVHYQDWESMTLPFDPARPAQLLYDGQEPGSRLVGLSYVVRQAGGVAPEGFAGDNDRWHLHKAFCLDAGRVNLSSDVLSPEECAAIGGTHVPNSEGWMLHVWVVPGCESDWGMFSGANPRLPYIPANTSFAPGCNSGKTLADPLELDQRGGRGPRLR